MLSFRNINNGTKFKGYDEIVMVVPEWLEFEQYYLCEGKVWGMETCVSLDPILICFSNKNDGVVPRPGIVI